MSDLESRPDCVIVLGAAFRDGRGGTNPALVRRARHGARLTRAGPGRVLIAVGGGPAREAAAIAERAQAAGVPATAIRCESRSRNTLQNALLTARLLRQHGFPGGLLVTDWPHLPRAWLCFRAAGAHCRPAPVPGTAGKHGVWLRKAGACTRYLGRLPRLIRWGRRRRAVGQSDWPVFPADRDPR